MFLDGRETLNRRLIRSGAAAILLAVCGCETFGGNADAGARPEVTAVETATAPQDASEGLALLEQERPVEAEGAFRARLAAAPDDLDARLGYAEALRQQGKYGPAEAAYLKVADSDAHRVRALEGLGFVKLATGDHNGAYEAFTAATGESDEAWRGWLGLAQLSDLAKDWVASEAAYASALANTDKPAVIYNNQGISMLARGESARAAALFEKALQTDPTMEKARTNLELAVASDSERAMTYAMAEPDAKARAQKLNNFGYVAMLQGRYPEAEEFYRQAIAAHPAFYGVAYENLSILKNLQADKKRAE